jgi:zinc protease
MSVPARAVPLVLAVALAAACGPRSPRNGSESDPWRRSGIDWSTAPAIAAEPWRAPVIASENLRNGVRVLVVENHRMPIVGLLVVHGSAGSRADGAEHGLAALTADALVEGTSIEAHIATDYATHALITTTARLPASLKELARMLQTPAFYDDRFGRVQQRRASELRERASRPRTIAAQVFDHVAFGDHPYAWPAGGLVDDVLRLTVDDLRTFWTNHYAPSATTIIFVGDITTNDAVSAAASAFEWWKQPTPLPAATPPALPGAARQLAYVDVPGAEETVVIIGKRTAGAGTGDSLPADLASTIVGGSPDAYLDRRLHGELALTFGASASFWRGRWSGSWTVATTFGTAATLDGIRATLDVIARVAEHGPSTGDLGIARANLLRTTEQSFDTIEGTLRAVERLVAHGLPLDHNQTLAKRVAAVTPPQINAAARIATQDLSIVVVGDWSKLAAPLRGLGLTATAYAPNGTRLP